MKSGIRLCVVMMIGFALFFTYNCKKDENNPVPVLTTVAVSSITQTSAICGGVISSDAGSTITVRGVCWSTGTSPTILNNKTIDGAGAGTFSSSLTELTGNTVYFVRAYATNSAGTGYGMTMSFKTEPVLTTLTTADPTSITQTTAVSGGEITSDGGAEVTTRGVCWSISPNPIITNSHTTDGKGLGSFTSSIAGLTANTTYYLRSYATNNAGTAYGNEMNFKTLATVPTLTTEIISSVTLSTAVCGGNITSDGGSPVTARGVCYSTTTTPTISNDMIASGTGSGSFVSELTDLTASTTYYVRSFATNAVGTSYGNELSFKTYLGTVTDADGNVYNTLTIGTQTWIAENLKTSKYSDNSDIPFVEDAVAWAALSTPGYCWYSNDATANKATYGALYNWYTVNTGRLCPTGWHVPSDAEWTVLTDYLGGEAAASGKLKEPGLAHWLDPNTSATNETGFTALPGGYRYINGTFFTIGYSGYWWSSIESDTNYVWFRRLYSSNGIVGRSYNYKQYGFSVRCLRDF